MYVRRFIWGSVETGFLASMVRSFSQMRTAQNEDRRMIRTLARDLVLQKLELSRFVVVFLNYVVVFLSRRDYWGRVSLTYFLCEAANLAIDVASVFFLNFFLGEFYVNPERIGPEMTVASTNKTVNHLK